MRHAGIHRTTQFSLILVPAMLLALFTLMPGCMHQTPRLQAEDETERDRYGVRTVGEFCTVGNAEPLALGGIGLVGGLEGSGGEPANDANRTMLEDDLKKQGVRNIKEMLASKEVALVLVSAGIPPGTRRGETIDVEVRLPPRSKATGLQGGFLKECILYNYNFAKNLSPDYTGPRSTLRGHPVSRAEGPLLVGFGKDSSDEEGRVRSGKIWGGGRIAIDWPFTLVLNQDQQFARVAGMVADQINDSFQMGKGDPGSTIANAKNNVAVSIRVPPQYKLNMPRFLRVVRLVPTRENDAGKGGQGRANYQKKLAEDLVDPARCITAALRLEALGAESIAVLKKALLAEHPLVRFSAAESLAYLGSPSCGEELARSILEQPVLRAFSLTAMASLDEAICQVKLREILYSATDDETRYGAFRALRTLDERNDAIQGEYLNESFWLHRVSPDSPGLVHISTSKRAEIVLFGKLPGLKPPFSILAGEYTVTTGEDDTRCNISRIPLRGGKSARKSCSLGLEEVIRTLADMGATYPDVTELLRQADQIQALTCRVRNDALPQAVSVYDLVKAGKGKSGKGGEALVFEGQVDLSATPNLYAKPGASRRPASPEGDLLAPGKAIKDKGAAQAKSD
ncbi:MAG: hypothetical protein EXR99_02560 [Gemmataceae bacterium]|nr:hypothetical protein [Gemmataceae bacterium]